MKIMCVPKYFLVLLHLFSIDFYYTVKLATGIGFRRLRGEEVDEEDEDGEEDDEDEQAIRHGPRISIVVASFYFPTLS